MSSFRVLQMTMTLLVVACCLEISTSITSCGGPGSVSRRDTDAMNELGETSKNCLSCYECRGISCNDTSSAEIEHCEYQGQRCYKEIDTNGTVSRGCSYSLNCSACSEEMPGCRYCCDSNLCNNSRGLETFVPLIFILMAADILVIYVLDWRKLKTFFWIKLEGKWMNEYSRTNWVIRYRGHGKETTCCKRLYHHMLFAFHFNVNNWYLWYLLRSVNILTKNSHVNHRYVISFFYIVPKYIHLIAFCIPCWSWEFIQALKYS